METQSSDERGRASESTPNASQQDESHTSTSTSERRDAPTDYVAWARDTKNETEQKVTRKWLDENVLDKNQPIYEAPDFDGGVAFWYGLTFDEAGLKAAREQPGLKSVYINHKVSETRYLGQTNQQSTNELLYKAARKVRKAAIRFKRAALEWTKYKDAPKALVMISQPKNKNLDELKDFIHEKNSGEGTFIYSFDRGINPHVKNNLGETEFKRVEPIQTARSQQAGEPFDSDDSPISHGTAVASVACGQRYGVSSEATMVYLKSTMDVADWVNGLHYLATTLPNDRVSKSIILVTHVLNEELWEDDDERDRWAGFFRNIFKMFHDKGIPVVVPAGNNNDRSDTQRVDELPGDLASDDLPLIVAGAATFQGYRWVGTQTGPKLTVYAPGENVAVQLKDDGKEGTDSGTSFATPGVAGLIATYLAYDDPPWGRDSSGDDFQGKARVEAIKNYIKSDASSYVRANGPNGVNIIWNGAPEDATDSSSAPSYTFTDLQCYAQSKPPKLGGKKQDYLDILPTFCDNIETHDHTNTNVFNDPWFATGDPNMPSENEVQFSVWWPPGSTFKPDKQACKAALEYALWNCDFGSDHTSGGQVSVDRVGYRVEPMYERPPPPDPDRPKPGQCIGSGNKDCLGPPN